MLYFCPLCQVLIDHRVMGLFLGPLFCSIDQCVCSYASTRLFWLLWPYNIVWCQILWSLLLCCSFLEFCGYSGLFMVPYKFLKCLFYICEICHWYFNRDRVESKIPLGSMDILMFILSIHEHGTCFHLFVPSLISCFSVV